MKSICIYLRGSHNLEDKDILDSMSKDVDTREKRTLMNDEE